MHIQGQPGFLPLDPRQGTYVCTSVCLHVWECELWGRHTQGSLAPRPRASTRVCGHCEPACSWDRKPQDIWWVPSVRWAAVLAHRGRAQLRSLPQELLSRAGRQMKELKAKLAPSLKDREFPAPRSSFCPSGVHQASLVLSQSEPQLILHQQTPVRAGGAGRGTQLKSGT